MRHLCLTCYVTYTNGVASERRWTPPDLVYDNGTSCGSTPAGFNASKTVCNNDGSRLDLSATRMAIRMAFIRALDLTSTFAERFGRSALPELRRRFRVDDGRDDEMLSRSAIPRLFSRLYALFVEQDSAPVDHHSGAGQSVAGGDRVLLLYHLRGSAQDEPSSHLAE